MKFKLCVHIIKSKSKITVSDDDSDISHCKLTWSKCREFVFTAVKLCTVVKKKVNSKLSKKDVLNESLTLTD